jgi:DNA-binding Lrp family transcriptional regulator
MNLDRKDLALLEALQQNASQRLEDLARLVHLAPSSVHDRLRRLQREGVIQGWTINVDAATVGLGVLAFISVALSRPCSEMIADLREIHCIEEAHSVAGEFCILLKVRLPDTAGLLALIERLRQIPGVEKTETTVVLATQMDRPTPLRHHPLHRAEAHKEGVLAGHADRSGGVAAVEEAVLNGV